MTDHEARDTRTMILATALDLFSTQGYSGTSLRQVADRMGFTKAALYYHFKSKEDLAREVLEPLLAAIDDLLDTTGNTSTHAARRLLLERYADIAVAHRQLIRIAFADLSMLHQAGLGPKIVEQGQRLAGLLQPSVTTLAGNVRVAVAIGGLQLALSSIQDPDELTVRAVAVEAAAAALGLRHASTN